MVLYMIPPVINELAKNMDQPQATVILRVTVQKYFLVEFFIGVDGLVLAVGRPA